VSCHNIFIFCLPDSRLQVGVHPAGPATGHLDTVNAEMVPKPTALLRACDAALPAKIQQN